MRHLLENMRLKSPVDWGLIEQDYALSWVLWGLYHEEVLAEHLVFKGGTCLKKCYFGDYRFSQDLDFSIIKGCPTGDNLENHVQKSITLINKHFYDTDQNVIFEAKRYVEKKPHPDNQEAFTVSVQYPWQREPLTRVMIEITFSEIICLTLEKKEIIHTYDEHCDGIVLSYSLEEIISEKIAALLSFSKKLHERGWGRSRARDYYDLWRILSDYNAKIDFTKIPNVVLTKCNRKGVMFRSYEDLFNPTLMSNLDKSWELWVKPLVVNLPDKEMVISDLKVYMKAIFSD